MPTDVDEARVRGRASRRRRARACQRWTRSMQAVEDEIRADARRADVLATSGGGFLGTINTTEHLRPHRAARGARLLVGPRLIKGRVTLRAAGRRSEATIRSATSCRRSRRRLGRFQRPPHRRSATSRRSTSAAAAPTSTSCFADRTSKAIAGVCRGTLSRAGAGDLGIVDADTTLRLNKPELRVADRPRPRRRPRRRYAGHRAPRCGSWSAATTKSRASATPRSTRTTTCSCGLPSRTAATRPRSRSFYVPRRQRRARAARQRRHDRRRPRARRASTAWTGSARCIRARNGRPGLRAGRPSRGAASGCAETQHAARLLRR